jgi:hypothetical protein
VNYQLIGTLATSMCAGWESFHDAKQTGRRMIAGGLIEKG